MVSRFPDGGQIPLESDPGLLLFEEVRSRVTPQEYETWLKNTPCRFQPPDRFVLSTTNTFRKAWMEKNFREPLRSAARALFEFEVEIDFHVERLTPPSRISSPSPVKDPETKDRSGQLFDGRNNGATARLVQPAAPTVLTLHRRDLRPDFLFDSFVVGGSNHSTHAAALAVCDEPGSTYNPLFIYGPPGVGKTHLLHAIAHRLVEARRFRLLYLTAGEFLSRFVGAVVDASRPSFSAQCREVDAFLLDDVHLLAGKDKTQEELFYSFNSLIENGKQIVLSSRSSPRETMGLEDRLSSRFEWGLVSRLELPEFELRLALLGRKARSRRLELPPPVAELIATKVQSTARELEGVLAALSQLMTMYRRPVDLPLAREAIEDYLTRDACASKITIEDIFQALEVLFRLKPKDLLARTKTRSIVLPRQLGMFLARELTQHSLTEIGVRFGGRDHTTVLYALGRVEALLKASPQVRSDLKALRNRLSSPLPR